MFSAFVFSCPPFFWVSYIVEGPGLLLGCDIRSPGLVVSRERAAVPTGGIAAVGCPESFSFCTAGEEPGREAALDPLPEALNRGESPGLHPPEGSGSSCLWRGARGRLGTEHQPGLLTVPGVTAPSRPKRISAAPGPGSHSGVLLPGSGLVVLTLTLRLL